MVTSSGETKPSRCPVCHHLTVEEWVRRVNAKAREIHAWEVTLHPSVWHEQLHPDSDAYRQIAAIPTCQCGAQATKGANQ